MCCVCVIPERVLFGISAVILAELWYNAKNDNFALCAKEFAFLLREKQFYKTFSVLALSLALHNLLSYSVNMMDIVMLGQYSQNAMSGVSLCNQVQFMLQMLIEGAGEGAVVLGAQYWGKNRLEPIPHIIGAAMRFGGGMAVVMFLIVRLAPEIAQH